MTETLTKQPVVTTSAVYDVHLDPVETKAGELQVPDLMASLDAAIRAVRGRMARDTVDENAIASLLEWSLNPDNFAPDAAERVRAEAWGRDFGE